MLCFWIIVPGVLVPGVRVLDVAIDSSGGFRLSRLPRGLFATNRVGSECEEMSSETSHENHKKWDWDAVGIKAGSNVAPTEIYLDALEDGLVPDEEDQIQVFALEMFMYCRDFPSSELGYEGLLVCKSQAGSDEAVYRRVGYFVTEEKPAFQRLAAEDEETWRSRNYECLKWFDDYEPQVITII